MDTDRDRSERASDILRGIEAIGKITPEFGAAMPKLTEQMKQVEQSVRNFNRTYGYFATSLRGIRVPQPKRGGTFVYCAQLIPFEIPRLDKLGRRTRYKDHVDRPCNRRFRKAKTYRRHWRRVHAPVLTESQQV